MIKAILDYPLMAFFIAFFFKNKETGKKLCFQGPWGIVLGTLGIRDCYFLFPGKQRAENRPETSNRKIRCQMSLSKFQDAIL